jgi:fructose-1,6-bisphosphatase/inositol monophosphatase family enzyme
MSACPICAWTHDALRPACAAEQELHGRVRAEGGRPGFGISIALFERGRPAAAVLDMPARDRRFESAAGTGTRLNAKSIRLSQVDALAEARLAVGATQYGMDSLRSFWDGVAAAALIPTPAFTPKFAAVLAGECDYLPVRPHPTAIWDYAAAAQLLAEAGGWFGAADGTDLLEALPFDYSDSWIATLPSLRAPASCLPSALPRWAPFAAPRVAPP